MTNTPWQRQLLADRSHKASKAETRTSPSPCLLQLQFAPPDTEKYPETISKALGFMA